MAYAGDVHIKVGHIYGHRGTGGGGIGISWTAWALEINFKRHRAFI